MATTNKKHPDILYHYCPLDTFVKIIKSKTLRFGDITRSNDSEELFYIYKLYHMYCNEGKTDGFNPNLFFAKQDNENNKTYCFCLSELKDDLPQWRGYAPNGGVAIGFDYEKLKVFSESITSNVERPVSLTKIIYVSDEPGSKNFYEKKDEVVNYFKGVKNGNNENSLEAYRLAEAASICKNDAFKCEKEWRIAFTHLKQENSNDKIEVSGVSVPLSDNAFYVPFHLSMISKIIIGPKVDFLGQKTYLPDMLYDFLKENDDEFSDENEYRTVISKKDIELTKLSYR